MERKIKEKVGKEEVIPEGYKKTVVGVIPVEWEVEKLISLFPKIRNGFVGTATPFYVEKGVKYLQGKNIKNGKIISDDMVYVSEEFHKKNQKSKLSLGDIVMVQSGHVGECAVINEEYENSNCHALIIMTPTSNINSYYYSYLFNSSYGNKLIHKIITGNTVEHILASDISRLRVPVPSFSEQQKIANILSTWDKAIELKEKLIEQKKEQKKGLMQRLLTGKIRWNDGSKFSWREIKKRLEMISQGKVPEGYHKTQIGIIPLEWRVKRLKDISKRVQRENDGNDHPVLTISSLAGFLNQNERFSKVIAGENLSKYILLFKNEFAYNKGNSKTYPYGCVFRLEDYDRALVPNVYYCFEIVNGLSEFYKHYFLAGMLNKPLSRVINTGVRNDGLLNLNFDDFFSLPIIVPPLVEQERIANILTTADKEIQQLERELEALKQQKKGLMQLLLTGKVRVKC